VSDERARLFVALELPESIRQALVDWRATAVHAVEGLRLVREEDLHVTMCFLGWQAIGEVDSIASACGVLAGEPGAQLRVAGSIWLPRRRPRVLAVELEDRDGALARIQSRLSAALESGGWYRPEKRPFLAHVTVARVRGGARVRAGELGALPGLAFVGTTVTLFRSRLSPAGARYEALASVELVGGERLIRLDAKN
jgi:RNA 2',3'-cyclic 3'-phosphodiesterase